MPLPGQGSSDLRRTVPVENSTSTRNQHGCRGGCRAEHNPPLSTERGRVLEVRETTDLLQSCSPRVPCVHLYQQSDSCITMAAQLGVPNPVCPGMGSGCAGL